ncbi:permease prefix domain 1-containing protein [Deinococcus roseus]|uniref:Uncharacterized protein n=1 Tax=Deinococcus roseus TaxID=392414 RepID=A0ABQ2CW02_9DEIO|nr:permease prefix domain 1-containing protein [Deinococcus roseus]GGJ25996.1 hypothetical protein GCM10008938_10200 [Deinococcus roseus]
MSTVDRYIKKATLGLPRKERLDLAVQLRMHMQEKTAEYMEQGFPREEAEYLTLQDMGDPQVPWMQRWRHFLQYQLPYLVLGGVLLWGWNVARQHPAPMVKLTPLTSAEWMTVQNHPLFKGLNRFESFSAVLPEHSLGFELLVFQQGKSVEKTTVKVPALPERNLSTRYLPSHFIPEVKVVVGFSEKPTQACGKHNQWSVMVLSSSNEAVTGCGNLNLQNFYPSSRSFVGTNAGFHLTEDQWLPLWAMASYPVQDPCEGQKLKDWRDCAGGMGQIEARPNLHWDNYVFVGIRALQDSSVSKQHYQLAWTGKNEFDTAGFQILPAGENP